MMLKHYNRIGRSGSACTSLTGKECNSFSSSRTSVISSSCLMSQKKDYYTSLSNHSPASFSKNKRLSTCNRI